MIFAEGSEDQLLKYRETNCFNYNGNSVPVLWKPTLISVYWFVTVQSRRKKYISGIHSGSIEVFARQVLYAS